MTKSFFLTFLLKRRSSWWSDCRSAALKLLPGAICGAALRKFAGALYGAALRNLPERCKSEIHKGSLRIDEVS